MEPTQNAPTDIKSRKKSPRETQKFWDDEITASQKMLERFQKQGVKIVRRYLDDRGVQRDIGIERTGSQFRLNLFHSNVSTLQDMLYGQLPTVEVSRTNADAADDVARVAGEMMERLLNLDIADNGQDYDSVLRSCLQDRLLPGLGVGRVRYEVETQEIEIPAQILDDGAVVAPAFTQEQMVSEDAPVDYFHWQDVLWGWGRSFSELPWIAFRSFLSKDEVTERFGAKKAKQVTYRKQKIAELKNDTTDPTEDAPWQKAEIWEIWDKELSNVVWYSKGADTLMERITDPLELNQFFPCPPFLIANPTTTLYRPVADYHLSQDLYNEVDRLQTRISLITEAVKVVGVYDKSADGIKRMLKEGVENDLIPVDNWAMFAEGGGVRGQIDWFPIQDVVNTLDKLIIVRDQTISLLQQTSGMSDIMRGSLQNQYEGVGQSQIKARYGSVRVQSLSEQFATFAGELMQLKAEVICRHFSPETIVKRSGMAFSMDAEYIGPAVQLLKNADEAHIRVKIRSETVAMEDFAQLKSERTEFMTGFATFLQSAAPMLQQEPDAMPYLLKMLQWTMSGFRGSSEIEGVLDKAVDGAIAKLKENKGKPNKEDQAEQAKQKGELAKIQAKGQADQQLRQADLQADMQTAAATHQAKMAEIQATHQSRMMEIQTKAMADMQKEQAQMEANVYQTEVSAETEMIKDEAQAELDMEKSLLEAQIAFDEKMEASEAKLEEIALQSATKLQEMITAAAVKPSKDDNED